MPVTKTVDPTEKVAVPEDEEEVEVEEEEGCPELDVLECVSDWAADAPCVGTGRTGTEEEGGAALLSKAH
jgi:hypothetical protein